MSSDQYKPYGMRYAILVETFPRNAKIDVSNAMYLFTFIFDGFHVKMNAEIKETIFREQVVLFR